MMMEGDGNEGVPRRESAVGAAFLRESCGSGLLGRVVDVVDHGAPVGAAVSNGTTSHHFTVKRADALLRQPALLPSVPVVMLLTSPFLYLVLPRHVEGGSSSPRTWPGTGTHMGTPYRWGPCRNSCYYRRFFCRSTRRRRTRRRSRGVRR